MYIRRSRSSLLIHGGLMTGLFFLWNMTFSLSAGELLEKTARSMGQIRTIQCRFVQEKRLKDFAFPMKITGVMASDHKAGRFAWRVTAPLQYNCIIEKGKLTQWDADSGKILILNTEKNQALKMLADTLKTLFSGDIQAMLKDFFLKKETNPLALYPKKGSVYSRFLQKITFTFSRDLTLLEQIEIEEKNGDLTKIRFYDTKINQILSSDLWQVKNTL